MSSEKDASILPLLADPLVFQRYAEVLQLDDQGPVVLAQAIAAAPFWGGSQVARLLVQAGPHPWLAALGPISSEWTTRIRAQALALPDRCYRFRACGYREAEVGCESLAAQLVALLGRDELRSFAFVPLPRGGAVVLGMLAYALDLSPAQVSFPDDPKQPLVIVDDCALTGERFRTFAGGLGQRELVFVQLFSHPDLRAALQARDDRVRLCLAAYDLHDRGAAAFGDEYPAWRARWLARLGEGRDWFGYAEHLGFPWAEPDAPVLNPLTGGVEPGWPLLPPQLCLKHRPHRAHALPVEVVPSPPGPWRPAPGVVYASPFPGQVVLFHSHANRSVTLQGPSAALWEALVQYGSPEAVVGATLLGASDPTTVRAFAMQMALHGLMREDR